MPVPDAFPRLRDEIDAAPASRDGETYYIIYDRAGIAPSRLVVSPLALLVASRLDGGSAILDIADRLSGEGGGGCSVSCSDVAGIVAALSEALFLEDAHFHDFREQADRDFRAMAVRPPGSAGSAYPDDPAALAAELDRMMAEAPPPEEQPGKRAGFPLGVVAPHIDYARGAHGYGQAYGLLRNRPAPRAVVVIGTAHLPMNERYALCEKDFATPLGVVPVDHGLCASLRSALRPHCDLDRDVLTHRGEHSVELQAVWLRHIYGDKTRIVPLVANSLGEFLEGGLDPALVAADPAIQALAKCLAGFSATGEVMLLASADLSHIGPRFGDENEISNQYLADVEAADREYLAATSGNAVAGVANLAAHGDRYHVCGSACIFAVRQALTGSRGRLLGYHQALTPEMQQAVTYASLVFERV